MADSTPTVVTITTNQPPDPCEALLTKIEAHLSVLRVKAEAEILDAAKATHNGWQRAKELVEELAADAKKAL